MVNYLFRQNNTVMYLKRSSRTPLSVLGLVMCVTLSSTAVVAQPSTASRTLTDFDKPFAFSYLAFENNARVADGVAHITAEKSQGGAGLLMELDLSADADASPALWIKVGPKNRAKQIKMFFLADKVKRMFAFDLQNVKPSGFTHVIADNALAVSPAAANETDQSFDPAHITMLQVQGDWSQDAVDVVIDKIDLVPPTAQMKATRAAHTERLARIAERKKREEEQRRKEIEQLIANAPHPADGARISHIGAVAEDTIALIIDSGQIVRRRQVEYQAVDGDQIVADKKSKRILAWEHGRIVDAPRGRQVRRVPEGQRKAVTLGDYVINQNLISPGAECRGAPLSAVTVDQPQAYRVLSADDATFTQPTPPAAVYVKSKPTGQAAGEMSVRYHVYLKLPATLRDGAVYTIQLRGLNTAKASVTYQHRPRTTRSEAIHVTQIGYRPEDSFKRAYLSLWMGTGGPAEFTSKTFELIDDASQETVYRGRIQSSFPAERVEVLRGKKNHTQANVYYLDFNDFGQPGTYRVFVPGIGVSYPFTIAENVWAKSFAVSMQGFLSHRSGIALGAPFTDYQRPRPMHPDDGVRVFELDVTFWNGESDAVLRSLKRLLGPDLDPGRVKTYPAAWGGYMDAGDWDRRSQHLTATWAHLELVDLFPSYFESCKLALPPNEANDNLPDLLNEALWNLDFYRRLQRDHGGVGGGVESTAHPRPGEASWQESLLLGTFAPDPESSLRYAACAAKASRLLRKYDRALADQYAVSAKRAWSWANANEDRVIQAEIQPDKASRNKSAEKLHEAVQNMRALAAAALYRLTGESVYHNAFKNATWLNQKNADVGKQANSAFAYALLPDKMADPVLKKQAIDWFKQAADDTIAFEQGNAFNLACRVAQLPVIGYVGYYSVPETTIGPILPRAHYLTGNEAYLRAEIAAMQFTAGANPMNMTLTTGLGINFPRHPLHVDSNHAGIEPPKGITVYGIGDPAISDGSVDWAHTWYLSKTMIPGSRTWPSSEFYIDLGNWPPTNEYTVHQTFRPMSYALGYLAACDSTSH